MRLVTASAAVLLSLVPLLAMSQPKTEPAPPKVAKSCRNVSAEIRSGAPLTREAVVAEMVRARAEGEMDYHISSTPPAGARPLCESSPAALAASAPAASATAR
ncbi:hypothetical protein [Mitsuaria sp. BK037]|uniref:hypothetical protein n=1 Tax=Mitsuaria sp. BK037 TaxID=2587122 RepID=UPI00161B9FF6|nr:hypothetical protein [Mitsuaria sp. BK037]MBB3282776.1 hypothetical protein [Mitsuaria sp. BK037]